MVNQVTASSSSNKVIVSTPGPQGPRGKTILNGSGAPANNLGLTGDFYYNIDSGEFYGPKLVDGNWDDVNISGLGQGPQGPTGQTGPQGPQGPAPWTFKGAYDNGRSYNLGEAVTYEGGFYYRTGNPLNPGYAPTPGLVNESWTMVADRGAQGPTGQTGPQGPQGPTGAGYEGIVLYSTSIGTGPRTFYADSIPSSWNQGTVVRVYAYFNGAFVPSIFIEGHIQEVYLGSLVIYVNHLEGSQFDNYTEWYMVLAGPRGTSYITVQQTDAQGNPTGSYANISTLQFDEDSGFAVTGPANNIAKVAMNSTFKYWNIDGEHRLTAVGLDTLNVISGEGISIIGDGNSDPQSLTISADTAVIATHNYVDTAISNLIGNAPDVLNTLNEISAAINNDPNFLNSYATQEFVGDAIATSLQNSGIQDAVMISDVSVPGGVAALDSQGNVPVTQLGNAPQPIHYFATMG